MLDAEPEIGVLMEGPLMRGVDVGKLVGGNQGLGYFLTFGEGRANTPMVFVSIVMLTVVGGIAYLAVILVERRVLHYLPARSVGGIFRVPDRGSENPTPLGGWDRGTSSVK